jgi:hypothetical protein
MSFGISLALPKVLRIKEKVLAKDNPLMGRS